jgi:hypothetical protein
MGNPSDRKPNLPKKQISPVKKDEFFGRSSVQLFRLDAGRFNSSKVLTKRTNPFQLRIA